MQKIIFIAALLIGLSAANATAQDLSAGLSASYSSDHGAPGIGFTANHQLSSRFEIELLGNFFIPENIQESGFNMTREYKTHQVFASIVGKVNIYNKSRFNVYGLAGISHKRIYWDGDMSIINDAPPYGTTTREFKGDNKFSGPQLGAGIEYGTRFKLYLQPVVSLFDGLEFSIASGLRVKI